MGQEHELAWQVIDILKSASLELYGRDKGPVTTLNLILTEREEFLQEKTTYLHDYKKLRAGVQPLMEELSHVGDEVYDLRKQLKAKDSALAAIKGER